MSKQKLWTKDFIIASSTNFFIFLTFYLLVVTLPVYVIEQYDASASQAGIASSMFIVGALVIRPFAGKYIELMGRKKILYGGLALFLVFTLLYFKADSYGFLLANRFMHGVAFGCASTAIGTIVADIIPNERRGEGTGYFAMSTNIAMAIGPFLGLFIIQKANFQFVFALCTLFSVVGIISTLFINIPQAQLTAKQAGSLKKFKLGDFFEASTMPIAIVVAIIGFTYSSVLSFLTTYSYEIGLVETASFFFVVFAIFLLVSRPFTGRLFDVRGENVVIYPSLFLFALGMFVLSQANISIMLLAAGALIGIGYGTFLSSAQAVAIKIAPRHRVGLVTSTFYVMLDLGIGIGPFLLGFLIPYTGFRGLYVSMAVIVLACLFLYYLLHGKKASKAKEFVHTN
jgi:MFS family permease